VIGAPVLELDRQPGDLQLEIVDQPERDVDVAAPRVRDLQAVEQLASGQAEQVADRARVPERDQRRMDPVLERRAMTHQVQPETRELTLTPNRWVGQPDRRHQIALGQHRQHACVDPIGLARQRGQPLDLLRVGDQHLPAELLERVVHEPRPVHRLDHRTHRLPITRHASDQTT
jgi:hypothetical protein